MAMIGTSGYVRECPLNDWYTLEQEVSVQSAKWTTVLPFCGASGPLSQAHCRPLEVRDCALLRLGFRRVFADPTFPFSTPSPQGKLYLRLQLLPKLDNCDNHDSPVLWIDRECSQSTIQFTTGGIAAAGLTASVTGTLNEVEFFLRKKSTAPEAGCLCPVLLEVFGRIEDFYFHRTFIFVIIRDTAITKDDGKLPVSCQSAKFRST